MGEEIRTEPLLDAFKELTLLELSEFVKKFEETFEVTAAAPVAVAATGAAAPAEPAGEQSEFDVILEHAGEKKIGVIKVVREIVSGLGLKEAKDLVDKAPQPLLIHVSQEKAADAMLRLRATGANAYVARAGSISEKAVTASRQSDDPQRQALGIVTHLYDSLHSSFGVGVKRVSREELRLLPGLAAVAHAFGEVWDLELLEGWLVTPNAHLNFSRPIDLVERGEISEVIAAIESAAWGVYA